MSRQQHMDTLDKQRLRIADDAERLADKAQSLPGELREEAKVAADRAKVDTKTTFRELGNDAKNIVTGAKNDTKNMAREGVRTAAHNTAQAVNPKRVARENPLLAFAGAVAAGFLIARMMPSRRANYGYQYRYAGQGQGDPTPRPTAPAASPIWPPGPISRKF